MKEIDICGCMRRDPHTNGVPAHEMEPNAKNRYNILAAATISRGSVKPVEFEILQECTNSSLFLEFVRVLIEQRTLVRGDIFVVNSFTIHMFGNNIGIQDTLFNVHAILMITLLPYQPEFNPTEFVFNTLLQILSGERARYNCLDVNNFLDAIKKK